MRADHPRAALLPSPVVHRELEAGIWWEQFVDLAQALGQRVRGQQRIVALAEVLVIHIEIQRQGIQRNGVGEGGQQVLVARLLCLWAVSSRDLAQLIGIKARLAPDLILHLLPRKVGELLRDPDSLHEIVPYVDEELEGNGEAVFHQPRRDEHALRVAQRLVAMADRRWATRNA